MGFDGRDCQTRTAAASRAQGGLPIERHSERLHVVVLRRGDGGARKDEGARVDVRVVVRAAAVEVAAVCGCV